MLFYDSTVNFNQNSMIFKLWSDLGTFKLHLYSCPHQLDDSHNSGQNVLVTNKIAAMKPKYVCWSSNMLYASN